LLRKNLLIYIDLLHENLHRFKFVLFTDDIDLRSI